MRRYAREDHNALLYAACNMCGRELLIENGLLKEGCFHGEQKFGYFSKKDGENHSFDICEACYDKLMQEFHIPVDVQEEIELL